MYLTASQTNDSTASRPTQPHSATQSSASFSDELDKQSEPSAQSGKTNEQIIAEYRAKLDSSTHPPEKMHEEMIANYLAKHEAEFQETYELYEKYKDVFTPKYSNYSREKAEKIARELNAQFPDYKAMRFKSSHGGTEEEREQFHAMFFDFQAFKGYLYEKYDLDMGLGFAYTPEGARAYNFAVYEQLENGVNIKDALLHADTVARIFGGAEGTSFQMMGIWGFPDNFAEAMQTPPPEHPVDYDYNIDLRKYGIEYDFGYSTFDPRFGTDKAHIKEHIAQQFDLYTFLAKHEKLIDQKVEELAERSPEWFAWKYGDSNYANHLNGFFKECLDIATLARNVFEKHADKIFQSNANNASPSTQELLANRDDTSRDNAAQQPSPLAHALQSSA